MAYLTPVPWELTGPAEPGWQEDPDFEFFEVHGSDGDLVALAAGEANARLIVAQSDLLAALEQIVALDDDPHPGLATWFKARAQAHLNRRAAIAKAKGI